VSDEFIQMVVHGFASFLRFAAFYGIHGLFVIDDKPSAHFGPHGGDHLVQPSLRTQHNDESRKDVIAGPTSTFVGAPLLRNRTGPLS
jgi:hypothetical protein